MQRLQGVGFEKESAAAAFAQPAYAAVPVGDAAIEAEGDKEGSSCACVPPLAGLQRAQSHSRGVKLPMAVGEGAPLSMFCGPGASSIKPSSPKRFFSPRA